MLFKLVALALAAASAAANGIHGGYGGGGGNGDGNGGSHHHAHHHHKHHHHNHHHYDASQEQLAFVTLFRGGDCPSYADATVAAAPGVCTALPGTASKFFLVDCSPASVPSFLDAAGVDLSGEHHIPVDDYEAVPVLPVAQPARPGAAPPHDAYYVAAATHTTYVGPSLGEGLGLGLGGAPYALPASTSSSAPVGYGPPPTFPAGFGGAASAAPAFYHAAGQRRSEPVLILLCDDADCTRCRQVVVTESNTCQPLRPSNYFEASYGGNSGGGIADAAETYGAPTANAATSARRLQVGCAKSAACQSRSGQAGFTCLNGICVPCPVAGKVDCGSGCKTQLADPTCNATSTASVCPATGINPSPYHGSYDWSSGRGGSRAARSCICNVGFFSPTGSAPCTPCVGRGVAFNGLINLGGPSFDVSEYLPNATQCPCAAGFLWDAGFQRCEVCPVQSHVCASATEALTSPFSVSLPALSCAVTTPPSVIVGIDYVLWGVMTAKSSCSAGFTFGVGTRAGSSESVCSGNATNELERAGLMNEVLFGSEFSLGVFGNIPVSSTPIQDCENGVCVGPATTLHDPCPGSGPKTIITSIQCSTCACGRGKTFCWGECVKCGGKCGGSGGGSNNYGGNGGYGGGSNYNRRLDASSTSYGRRLDAFGAGYGAGSGGGDLDAPLTFGAIKVFCPAFTSQTGSNY